MDEEKTVPDLSAMESALETSFIQKARLTLGLGVALVPLWGRQPAAVSHLGVMGLDV